MTERSFIEHPFDIVLRDGVTGVLRPAGFRKSALSYHRRRGTCVQVINIQKSQGSTSTDKRFYINVGLAFDAICGLKNRPVLEKPKEYECDDRGTRDRLGQLLPGVDEQWDIRSDDDPRPFVEQLGRDMTALVAELNQIDGPASYRSHRWFDRYRPKAENAQILFLLGDLQAARQEIEKLVVLFADRRNAPDFAWWVQQLGIDPNGIS
jgi:hypothetical protein